MTPADSVAAGRYLTFGLGSQLYALPSSAVSEVIRLTAVARVPQGPRALLGVANLRGTVVPVVGLRELLGAEQASEPSERLALLLDHAMPTALAVDFIGALEAATTEQIETGHKTWNAEASEKLVGAFQIQATGCVAKVLDIDELLQAAFTRSTGGRQPERRSLGLARRLVSEQMLASTEMLVTFEVAGQEFALPLKVVEEILPVPPSVTTVTRTDSVILGFAAVRDGLIPLLSLRGLLGFGAAAAVTQREKVVVLKIGGAPIGLVADAARSVIAANVDAMEAVPPVLAARTGGESRVKAVYRGEAGRRLISVLSPEHLFGEDVMQRLSVIHPNVAAPKVAGEASSQEELIFLVFRLGDDEFGLPIDAVVEVAQIPAQITRIPKTPKFLDGVVNLRGDVLPVVDQRRRFDMAKYDRPEARQLIVVKTDQHRAGIIVDRVAEVLRTSRAAISPYPDLTAHVSHLVHGVVNLEASHRLVLLLDPAELLTRAEQGQLENFQAQSKKASA